MGLKPLSALSAFLQCVMLMSVTIMIMMMIVIKIHLTTGATLTPGTLPSWLGGHGGR